MRLYHDRDNIQIWCGDCRELLPQLAPGDAIITDPVWPNATADIPGRDDPLALFTAAAKWFPRLAKRAVIQLGCDSDPRFLIGMPAEMPYFRTCWLEYVMPSYKGRVLYTSDVAYVFGEPPPSEDGARVIPGRFIQTCSAKRSTEHPCPRRLEHVKWLVKWFARGTVLDPFMGSGTTAVACLEAGLPFVGIEISEEYCDLAVQRLAQRVLPLEVEE